MSLLGAEPRNLFSRLGRLILGRERPDFLTRMSFLAGFIIWLYLASWHLLTLLAVVLRGTLNKGYQAEINRRFIQIGLNYDLAGDPENTLIVHAVVQLLAYFVMLAGLVLIYRRIKVGFMLYIVPAACTFLFTWIIMGTAYMIAEFSYVDFALLAGSALYFTLGAVLINPLRR